MPDDTYAAYAGANPYFELVREALGNRVDGEHFFDILAEDVVYDVLYNFPGWPRQIRGRQLLMAQFLGYVSNIRLTSTDKLVVHAAKDAIVLEYEVRGDILATGAEYENRFCS